MKAYKVVWKDDRSSLAITSRKYERYYLSGEVVEAEAGSLGVMCFETLQQAQDFAGHAVGANWEECCEIITVKPIGSGLKPPYVSRLVFEDELDAFYKGKGRVSKSPQGTICFRGVKVIE